MSQSFREIQHTFIQQIKQPEVNSADLGIEDRRLKIYRDLFFNNILGFLNSGFPVLASVYDDGKWRDLARQFFVNHDCRSPYFIDISKEFVEFLSNQYLMSADDPVFLKELAHYEWLELDVSVRKSHQIVQAWDASQPFDKVQMSEVASLVSYQYPVHQINSEFQPTTESDPIYIVVYRDNRDEVNFTQVNTVSAHLINTISQHEYISVDELTELMAQALPQLSSVQLNDALQQVLQQLLSQQILLALN